MTTKVCHCGGTIVYGYDGDPTHHRGMCEHCDAVRCDAYPGACYDEWCCDTCRDLSRAGTEGI